MSDLISRQAAIEAIVDCTVYGDADELEEAVMQGNDWNRWSGGVLEALEAVKELPSVQPETVRCKDCMHYGTYYRGNESKPVITHLCKWCLDRTMEPDDFCSRAERRTDEQT